MNVGIIGCGNIGTKRARVVARSSADRLAGIVEIDRARWAPLEEEFGCPVTDDPRAVIDSDAVTAVIVSTPPSHHIALIESCLRRGKDVLCEKPMGDTLTGVRTVTELANGSGRVLKCGFNLRHDPALEKAHALCQQGVIGRPYFLKAQYVNGCALVNTNGVGSLMDLGSHLLDLARWFGAAPEAFRGHLQRTESASDDNGFLSFRAGRMTGQLHFSMVRWRNHFQFEVWGEKGGVEVVSLPKWGRQEFHVYRRVYPSGVPEIATELFEGDESWEREWHCFREACRERSLSGNADALRVMEDIASIRNTISEEDRAA